jgi:hypothetical protein
VRKPFSTSHTGPVTHPVACYNLLFCLNQSMCQLRRVSYHSSRLKPVDEIEKQGVEQRGGLSGPNFGKSSVFDL